LHLIYIYCIFARNHIQLTLFLKKELDGAWVPEPWATRLVKEANGKILTDERDLWPPEGKFVTAHIIIRPPRISSKRKSTA
jgi:NitT/TauT family transport system substrate-binding protein